MNQEVFKNPYQKEWKTIEDEKTHPRFLREIISTPYIEFREKVLKEDPEFAQTVVKSLYSGDVYILKQAFPKKNLIELKAQLHQYGKNIPTSFHKMLDECPDFHRKINYETAKNYSLWAIKHAYYFFPWNNDPFNLFDLVNERWRVFKLLGGFSSDAYEKNIPSRGVVDRLQIAQYVSGAGELELHADPYLYQKVGISGIMSKRGEDFKTGGAYILSRKKEKIDIENYLDIGDIYLIYPTVFHGVEVVDKNKEVNWDSIDGRWWLGLYSNSSDLYAKRHTCYGVEDLMSSGAMKTPHPR